MQVLSRSVVIEAAAPVSFTDATCQLVSAMLAVMLEGIWMLCNDVWSAFLSVGQEIWDHLTGVWR